MLPTEIDSFLELLRAGDRLTLARAITIVENKLQGSEQILTSLKHAAAPRIVGITGPPGAGKSTLVNALLGVWTSSGLNIAVIAVDPSSPFHYGSLLGDRIRMTAYYNHPQVFIRSLASRGALGGLHPRIYEITDVVKEAGFDIIVIETVGVGQSEVDIAGIADCTVVTLVPEAGDMIQTMKAGLLEIADIFVVNKSDRDEAELMYRHLCMLAHEQASEDHETPVVKTISSTGEGVKLLADKISEVLESEKVNPAKRTHLQLQKLWHLIQERRMSDISKISLMQTLEQARKQGAFNIYQLAIKLAENGPTV